MPLNGPPDYVNTELSVLVPVIDAKAILGRSDVTEVIHRVKTGETIFFDIVTRDHRGVEQDWRVFPRHATIVNDPRRPSVTIFDGALIAPIDADGEIGPLRESYLFLYPGGKEPGLSTGRLTIWDKVPRRREGDKDVKRS